MTNFLTDKSVKFSFLKEIFTDKSSELLSETQLLLFYIILFFSLIGTLRQGGGLTMLPHLLLASVFLISTASADYDYGSDESYSKFTFLKNNNDN